MAPLTPPRHLRTARATAVAGLAVLASLSFGACAAPRAGASTGSATAGLRTEILAVETAWNDALVRKDTAFIARLLTPDFVYVAPNGYQATRAELLGVIANPDVRLEPMITKDVDVRQYGDAVVVTGWFRQAGTNRGTPFETFIRYTDVYVRQDGAWRAVSAHASQLARAPGA